MIGKSFFGLAKPRIEYRSFQQILPAPEQMSMPQKVTLLIDTPFDRKDEKSLKKGDSVKTGQRLSVSGEDDTYVISTVTGTVSTLSNHMGDFGRSYTAVSIEVAEIEEVDDQFETVSQTISLENALKFLTSVPGKPPLKLFLDPEKPIRTIVICGVDKDLLIGTNRYVIQSEIDAIVSGIDVLKQISGVKDLIIAVSEGVIQGYGHIGATVKSVDAAYPAALPQMMMQSILGRVTPAGKKCEDLGVGFFSAEAVASIGRAFKSGRIPVTKTVTCIKKDGSQTLIAARIGTPVGEICKALNIDLKDKDRIIFGGPMTGSAVYSLDYPIQPDTDAVVVQDSGDITAYSDYPCINCGECIRICPVNIPINMLVRFLEAGHYEEGADQYDLNACIECGLCSFVCVSRIPIFQYIRLAKHELDRNNLAEATNV